MLQETSNSRTLATLGLALNPAEPHSAALYGLLLLAHDYCSEKAAMKSVYI